MIQDMFCYQCEQRAKGTGCTVAGVCGKDENTAVLQDLLIHVAKGISIFLKPPSCATRSSDGIP